MAAPVAYPGYDPSAYQGAPAGPAPAAPGYDPYAAQYAQPPAYAQAAPAYYGHPDEVRTVFITGFPDDIKERELNNLLRFLPGYEASQMNYKNGQAQGFALFHSGAAARAAVDQLHNMVFDETATIRCEVARKNMYLKDDHATKRGRFDTGTGSASGSGYPAYPTGAGGGYFPAPAVAAPVPAGPRQYAQISNTKDNPPCNTLFIGNLGDSVSEAELRSVFSILPGFQQIKLGKNNRNISCFVEFRDLASAMGCHQSQQGLILNSSDRGGIRIQYSKNPFGKKRDFDSSFANTTPVGSYAPPAYDPAAYGGAPGAQPGYGGAPYGAVPQGAPEVKADAA
eukprot:jgi/Astpho2/4342/Aster-07431